jgi:carboxylesterase
MKEIMRRGEPFFFPGNRTGCLLIHGFTGTPKEMRGLGENLASMGYSVHAPRLFGHATDPNDLIRARWPDWVASTLDGFHLLRNICDHIVVLGLSMGGTLSLYLAARLPISGVVAMSTPFKTPHTLVGPMRPIIPLLSRFWRFAGKGPPDWIDQLAFKEHIDYPAYPVRGGAEIHDLQAEMRQGLAQISMPVLLIYSKLDQSVTEEHGQNIKRNLTSAETEILWLENSGHVITDDADRQLVYTSAANFVKRVTESVV